MDNGLIILDNKIKFNDIKKDIVTENSEMYQSNLYFLPRLPLWKFIPYR